MNKIPVISGIYKLTNLTNGKSYIGKSLNIYKRWTYHRNVSERIQRKLSLNHKPTALHLSMAKYGIENFKFEVLLDTSEIKNINDTTILDFLEIVFIASEDTFRGDGKGYNLTRGGDGGHGIDDNVRKSMASYGFKNKTHPESFYRKKGKPILCIETNEFLLSSGYAAKFNNVLTESVALSARKGCRAGKYHYRFISWEEYDRLKCENPLFEKPLTYLQCNGHAKRRLNAVSS